jgi:outer membrane protein, heavy metal efflux system
VAPLKKHDPTGRKFSGLCLLVCSISLLQQPPALGQSSLPDVPLRGPVTEPVSITQAMSETLVQSPRAASLRLQLGIAKSNLVRATQMPNPSFLMDNGYRAEFTYRYGLSIPLEPPWKMALRIIAAKKEIRRVDFEIAKALWALRGDIRRAYTEVLIGQERFETLKELASLSQVLLTTAEKKCKAGDVARVDVFRADLACTQAAINRDQAAAEVLRAKQSLNVLLGRRHDLDIKLPRLESIPLQFKAEKLSYLPDLEAPVPALNLLESMAYEHRLELKIVDQATATARANLKVSYSNVVPTPAIGVGTSAVNGPPQVAGAGSFSPNTFHGFFFQTFAEIPIFNFQQGDISKYKSVLEQLRAERLTQRNIIEQDVVNAYQAVVMQRQKIQTYQEKALSRSTEIAGLMQRSYQVGEKDITAALQAQQGNAQVRSDYLDAIKAYELAYTALEQAIGTTLY